MQTLDAIRARRAVRGWTDRPVADDILRQVLEAGRFAPSPLNSQPWHFTVIRSPDTIKDLMQHANHGSFLSLANVVIVVTVDRGAKVDDWLSAHHQHIFSGVCALENMWLAACDLGLGGCWVTLDEETTRSVLSIPDEHELLGSLALGYPAGLPRARTEQDRRPLANMISYETFGVGSDVK